MLLDKFKSNSTFNFILFPLLGILFWLSDIVYPKGYPFYPGEESNLLYAPLHSLLQHSLMLQNIISLVLFLSMAFIVMQISIRYNILRIRTVMPATLFVIMAGGFTGIHSLHPVHFGALFFLIALYRLLIAFDNQKPYSAAFDTGFFLGIASLFYFSIVAFLPAFLIGIGILSRETRWRCFLILLTGFALPFLFGASYLFYVDELEKYLGIIKVNVMTSNSYVLQDKILQGYLVLLGVMTILGSLKLINDYDTKKVSTRKYFIVFFLLFLTSMAALVFVPAVSQEMLLITIIPVTFLLSNYFVFIKSHFLGELIFISLLVVVTAIQFIS